MYIFIINPVSGNGRGHKIWNNIKLELADKKMEYRSFFTKYSGHAEEIAEQLVNLHEDEVEAVIVVGGDGTMHEVVNGMHSFKKIPIGYIPAGSGNDFARGYSIPISSNKALAKILAKKGKPVSTYDVGRYQLGLSQKRKRVFVNGVGIGFDGDVAKITNRSFYKKFLNKLKLGALAYAVSVIRLLFTYKTKNVALTVDGKKQQYNNVWLIAITNIAYYGGGMKISPTAKMDDGKLNLCVVHNLSRWKLLFIFGTVFFGQHSRFKEVSLLEGEHIEVSSTEPMTIHADGEIIGTTPVSIQIDTNSRPIIC